MSMKPHQVRTDGEEEAVAMAGLPGVTLHPLHMGNDSDQQVVLLRLYLGGFPGALYWRYTPGDGYRLFAQKTGEALYSFPDYLAMRTSFNDS